MKTTTAAYKRIIASGNTRKFLVNINMTLTDGTSLTLTEEDIWADSFSIDTASSGKSSLDIGYAVIGQCSFQIENFDERFNPYDFFNASAVVWVKLEGDTQYYRMGFFTVDEPEHNGILISLILLNNMWKFDNKNLSEVGLSFPCSCQTAITTVCAYCGVTLATSQFHGYQFTLTKAPEKDMNCREFIQYVAMIGCNFCIIDDTGALRLKWYDVDSWVDDLDGGTFDTHTTPYSDGDIADGGNFLVYEETKDYDGGSFLENTTVAYFTRIFGTPQIGTDEINVTGVKIEIDETTYMVGTEGYVIDLKENPLLTASNVNAALNLIWDVLRGFRFRTFDITTLPDLAVEIGDCCAIRDAHGNYVHSYITNNSFGFSNHQVRLGAITPMRSLVKQYSKTVQAAVEIARKKTDEAISNYDVAVQLMNSLAINAMGAYQDYEDIPTGGRIYYLSNMPITKENGVCHFTPGSTVFMISGSGFFVSTQGGLPDTWDNGYDPETGVLLVNILKAIGVEADWIQTGLLRDKDGYNYWDLDHNIFRLAANATVGGQTVKQIADDSSEPAWAAGVQNKNYGLSTYLGVKIVNGVVTEGTGTWSILSSYVRDSYYGKKNIYVSMKIKRTGVRNTNPNVYLALQFKIVGTKDGNTVSTNIGLALKDTLTSDDADFVIKYTGFNPKQQTASTMDEITNIENVHISNYTSTQGTMEIKEVMVSLYGAYTWVAGVEDNVEILEKWITDTYSPDKLNLQHQIDGKAETWYQASDPSSTWATSELKLQHLGDLWYRTTDNTTWYYDGTQWIQQNVPTAVFDKIDGKAHIYTSQPNTPYNVGDLWFASTSSEIKVCITARATGSFVSSDWIKRDKYVDSTDVSNAITAYDGNLGQTAIYNKLTNGSQNEGIFLQGNHLYLNASMINAGSFSADRVVGGSIYLGDLTSAGMLANCEATAYETTYTNGYSYSFNIGYSTTSAKGFYIAGVETYNFANSANVNLSYTIQKTTNGGTSWTSIKSGSLGRGIGRIPYRFEVDSNSVNKYFRVTISNTLNTNFSMVASVYKTNTIIDEDGILTNKLISLEGCQFGNLFVDKKIINPDGEDREIFYIYSQGWKEYFYQEWSTLSSPYSTYIYFSPANDGWKQDVDINMDFSCDDSTSIDHDNVQVCKITLYRWTGSSWSTKESRRFNYAGWELDDKDTYFTGFSATDQTIYRIRIQITRKTWASNYVLDIWADEQNILEMDAYETVGNFRGSFIGSATFYALAVGETNISPSGVIKFDDDESSASYSIAATGFSSSNGSNNRTSLSSSTTPLIEARYDSSNYIALEALYTPKLDIYASSLRYVHLQHNQLMLVTDSEEHIYILSTPHINVQSSDSDYIDITDSSMRLQSSNDKYCIFRGNNNLLSYRSGTTYSIVWTTSDRRFKEEIEPLDVELSKNLIDGTETKKFKYKDSEGKHYGMIAQDTRELLDNLGETDAMLEHCTDEENEMNPRTIDYHEYIPHLINYVKDLRAEINILKMEINELKEGK